MKKILSVILTALMLLILTCLPACATGTNYYLPQKITDSSTGDKGSYNYDPQSKTLRIDGEEHIAGVPFFYNANKDYQNIILAMTDCLSDIMTPEAVQFALSDLVTSGMVKKIVFNDSSYTYQLNKNHQVTSYITEDGSKYTFTYKNGRLTSIYTLVDWAGPDRKEKCSHTFSYDSKGNLSKVVETGSVNEPGEVICKVDSNGRIINMNSQPGDAGGRNITNVSYKDGRISSARTRTNVGTEYDTVEQVKSYSYNSNGLLNKLSTKNDFYYGDNSNHYYSISYIVLN